MQTSTCAAAQPPVLPASRENNFNMVRLVAAFLVMAGHMGQILGVAAPVVGSFALHTLGVSVLFLMGGYLITQSWLSDPHPLRFAVKRFFRLWPPYAVMILLMTFVAGPLLSSLGAQGYLDSWYRAYLDNLRFCITYSLPGVFEGLPVPGVVNGSLWTMPVEAALYVLTPLLLVLVGRQGCRKGSFPALCCLTAVMCAFDLWLRRHPEITLIFYATDWVAAYHLMVFYVIGVLFTCEEMKRLLRLEVAVLGLLALPLVQSSYPLLQQACLLVVLPYFVFSFALSPRPVFSRLGRRLELSYGVYLYGFFFQQLVVSWKQQYDTGWGYLTCLGISLLLTLMAAALSCLLVENPTNRLCRFLLARCCPKRPQEAGAGTGGNS